VRTTRRGGSYLPLIAVVRVGKETYAPVKTRRGRDVPVDVSAEEKTRRGRDVPVDVRREKKEGEGRTW
jgi:hypothetical protein